MKKTTASLVPHADLNETSGELDHKKFYLPPELMNCGLPAINSITQHRRTLRKGEYLYHMGDPLASLHVIRNGSIKTSKLTRDGRIQVIGFHVAGELLGIDAISHMQHPSNAVALETTSLCEIPYFWLEELAHNTPELQRGLMQLLSREIVRDEELLVMLGRQNAEARLAACLLNLSRRSPLNSGREKRLKLTMSRQDLADHLGLALETVSRLFSRLQAQGILRVHNRQIYLLDPERLEALVEHCTSNHRLHA
jgi:CRP/FNR family transcriptional regulator, anaerobic regulatory protein